MAPAHDGYALGLGSHRFPSDRFLVFWMFHALLGGAGAICVAVGVTRWRSLRSVGEARWFLPVATGLGAIIPAAIRWLVLQGGAVADDEAVYRFSAELVASGRLTAPSHPLKLFFDHAFMVNDGRMFSQYFLGWPAIMALGIPFGATGYVNSVVSAATIPALYELLKIFVGVAWARLGVLVFLTSPMIQIAAATEMSHTSALGSLVYAMWFVNLALRGGGPGTHFGFGLSLALSFFIRPVSAVAVALPWALLWMWRQLARREFVNILWFGVPTIGLAALFLFVNAEQTGSPFGVAYQRAYEYGVENGLRFSHVMPGRADETAMLASGDLPELLSTVSIGLLRLNISLFGWPVSFAFLPLAIGLRRASWWWASVGVYAAIHPWVFDAIDRRDIHNAVVFVNRQWAAKCIPDLENPPKHFVSWWPVNDPDFENDVIWANHLSVEQDRRLLAAFPGREGYISWWNVELCKLNLIAIQDTARMGFPNGFMGPGRYTDDHPPSGELLH